MVDAVEDLIRTELGRLAAPVADRTPEWSDVRARVPHVGRVPITALRIALAVAVVVAVAVPAVAFSAGVRPSRLRLAATAVRTGASDCRRSSARRARRASLGVALDHRRRLPLRHLRPAGIDTASKSRRRRGRVFPRTASSGVQLEPVAWQGPNTDGPQRPHRPAPALGQGGSALARRLARHHVARRLLHRSRAVLNDPAFRLLPVSIVAFDKNGHTVSTSRIPSSFLYSHWKREQPKLRVYRRAHGCSTTVVWRCRSR